MPCSQSVYRCSGKIFDRNYDSDIDITDNEGLVYKLYARKQDTYYVNKVFPVFTVADRDYSNAYVAKLVIEKDRIFTENSNRSHGFGNLDPSSFEPFPKNPPISKVFREVGLADELGSGMRNTYKYTKLYSGADPTFIEGDVFRIIVPLHEAATATVGPPKVPKTHDDTLDDTLGQRILLLIKMNPRINQRELSQQLDVSLPTIKRAMFGMVEKGVLERKGGKRYGHWEIKTRELRSPGDSDRA